MMMFFALLVLLYTGKRLVGAVPGRNLSVLTLPCRPCNIIQLQPIKSARTSSFGNESMTDHPAWGKRPFKALTERRMVRLREDELESGPKDNIAVKIKDFVQVLMCNELHKGRMGHVEQFKMVKREYFVRFISDAPNPGKETAWIAEKDLRKSMTLYMLNGVHFV